VIVVIQCAATKHKSAGFWRGKANQRVSFVADPARAPLNDGLQYARPDDSSEGGASWRELLLEYNTNPGNNPMGLYPAYQLYENEVYQRLVERMGVDNMYILSAGWGLIRASYLTPQYDITFSNAADAYKRRRKADSYADQCMLAEATEEHIVFFGGKDYVPLFCAMTRQVKGPRTVFYSSQSPPAATNCSLQRFVTTTRTNWHYECAKAFLAGAITLENRA
jgi:hypothetical protein